MSLWVTFGFYLAFVLGGVGLYFLMPQPGRARPLAGAVIGLIGLATWAVALAASAAGGSPALFYVLATVALIATVRVITHPRPVYSALYFVLVVLTVAALCLMAQAEFLAVAIVIIYAGAILVTYVFVIMLATQGAAPTADARSREPFLSIAAGFVTMAALTAHVAPWLANRSPLPRTNVVPVAFSPPPSVGEPAAEGDEEGAEGATGIPMVRGHSATMGTAVMSRYIAALEISALLLLIAMVGAVAISRKRVPQEGVAALRPPPGQTGREVEPF